MQVRYAVVEDLERLIELENRCFSSDILSRRSFQRFIRSGPHDLLVVQVQGKIAGYVLVLYRTGTNLGRLYSIAIHPDFQGQGFAKTLVREAEQAALKRHCVFMRLEVNVNNQGAIHLYEKQGYHRMETVLAYYDDGSDALRMEKRILLSTPESIKTEVPYYKQTTEFSCGPAALMMAMKALKPSYELSRREELQIWREATTIFMTSGHGGCSPYGLALSAWDRGFSVTLYINRTGAPFVDGVRDADKKAVIELVHEDFMTQLRDTDIQVHVQETTPEKLKQILASGNPIIALISTWRLNRNKAPHWVFLSAYDQEFVYVNDPDILDKAWQSEIDYMQVPITMDEFIHMACFGQTRLRCFIRLGMN